MFVGDCVEVLRRLPAESVDAVVTDPPYDLLQASRRGSTRRSKPGNPDCRPGTRGGFMGMAWDATGVAFRVETWEAVHRILRPGGYLLAFGGTRTSHRMTCAIEDAGFEIRDSIMWLYGSGFPKNLDVGRAIARATGGHVSRAAQGRASGPASAPPTTDGGRTSAEPWQGWGTALKPAHEPIVVARKPLSEPSVAANVLRHSTGALNIDGCRIGFAAAADEAETKTKNRHGEFGSGPPNNRIYGRYAGPRTDYDPPGRWPANVVLSHDITCRRIETPSGDGQSGREAWECSPACPIGELDRQSGPGRSRAGRPRSSIAPGPGYGMTHTGAEYDDFGGASRFFYAAKASTRERNLGLDGFPERPVVWSAGTTNHGGPQSETSNRAAKNHHPCVKPISLMRYLCRLVARPGGTILDPFMGSGSTGVAAVLEGLAFLGIELSGTYAEIAQARIEHLAQVGQDAATEAA